MLAYEWVRKLIERWGSRPGASRSAILSTPPRLGVWAADSTGHASRASMTRIPREPYRLTPHLRISESWSPPDGPIIGVAFLLSTQGPGGGRAAAARVQPP